MFTGTAARDRKKPCRAREHSAAFARLITLADSFFDCGLEIFAIDQTDHLLHHLTVFEQQEGRDGTYRVLAQELDGILLWSLFGLKDLLANKGFCVPTQVQKLKKVFELRSTSVESFFEERVDDSDSTENTPSPKLYQAYIRYCKEYKIPPETNRGFLTSVKNLGYEISHGGKNVNFVRGVCLKEKG